MEMILFPYGFFFERKEKIMAITKSIYGKTPNGEEVYSYTLDNGNGVSAEILTYGGIVKNLYVADKNDVKTDVVLGRDTLEDYLKNDGYIGAAIGRHANRIARGEFELNGKTYHVGINEGKNSLHGGVIGYDSRVWTAAEGGEENAPSLILTLTSPDGEEGFPGNVEITMTYTITSDNALKINYKAVSDSDTVLNLTNHSYFNLAGHDSGNMTNQILQINSGFFTPNDDECMPTGEVLSVEGTPFDFRTAKPIGQDINADFAQIQMFGGYDHNFAIEGRGFRLAATAECVENGIKMEVRTDKPAMQLYTSNGLPEGTYKNGATYKPHDAFCLETQYFPNAMAHSHYPSPILRKGDVYDFTTEYKFIVK
jgi:aldose 1-epimerase